MNDEILVSKTKHQYNHTYGIDLSCVIDQCKMNKQERTCHLCCLFALKCSHQFQSLNYSINSNIGNRTEINSNAILSSIDIWKDENQYLNLHRSPLYNIPLCFHKNFSSNKQSLRTQNLPIEEQIYSIKKILSSDENLRRRLPKTRLSQGSSIDRDIIEPITLKNEEDQLTKTTSSCSNHIQLISTNKFTTHQNNDCLSSLSSSSSDVSHSKPRKKLKIMNKEILVNKRSSAHHQSNKKYTSIHNKCNHMTKRTSFSQPTKSEFSQITISQFIQDINTNNEASITSPKPIEFNPLPKSHYSSDGYYLTSPTSIFPNSTKPLTSSIPTVPKCVNEYFQFNSNSFRYQKRKHSDGFFQLNLFDSSLFQWEIFNSNQRINYFCRKHSLSSIKTSKSPIQSFIDHIQSQRQYVPLKYSSWNILFPHYHPAEFSLKQCHLQENFILKNPYGRTGLTGHSLFEKYGANRYIISLIIIEKKYILLTKNQFNKWELPKSKILNKTIRYHTLDIAYIDHPLNTDDTWLEVQIILIENSMEYFKKKTFFSLDYLHRLNNIEHFDLDLIQFYI